MSDVSTTTPQHDGAIKTIDDQIRLLENDIAANTRQVEIDTAIRDRLAEIRAQLCRTPRTRRPRVVEAVEPPAEPEAEAAADAKVVTPSAWAGFGAAVTP
jgi:hypothetical protein